MNIFKKKGFTVNIDATTLPSTDIQPVNDKQLGLEAEPAVPLPEGEVQRAGWGGHIEYFLTVVGYAVGLGNVWRFPYLCYKNGGGAFLIPYVISLICIGMPLFFLETSFGQFASLGPLSIWSVNPIMQGIGVGMLMVSLLMALYYIIIICWAMYFFFASMGPRLPWTGCNNPWNTIACFTNDDIKLYRNISHPNSTWINNYNLTNEMITKFNRSATDIKTPSEEYFYNNVLGISDGFEHPGNIRWQLALLLLLSWMVVFLVLIKGIQSLGKVVYFTAVFPYVLLTIMLIRGVTLDGAIDGIKFYMVPKWEKLGDATVWSDAAVQIFYSLSECSGGLIVLASYNKFNNNAMRDAIVVPIINCLTSIYAGFVIFSVLGYMAKQKGVGVQDVATSGPGLVFVVYPEGLATMPVAPLWAMLFFFMLCILGFNPEFSNVECFFSSLTDEFPKIFRRKNSVFFFRFGCCCIFYLLGLPMITNGGFYVFNLCDTFIGGFPLLFLGLFEFMTLSYIYGYSQYAEDVKMMIGRKPGPYFMLTWCFISPAALVTIIVFKAVQYKTPTLGSYTYPPAGEALGWLMVAGILFWVPFLFLVYYCKNGGFTLLRKLNKSLPEWGPALSVNRTGKYAEKDKRHKQEMELQEHYGNNISFVETHSNDNKALLY